MVIKVLLNIYVLNVIFFGVLLYNLTADLRVFKHTLFHWVIVVGFHIKWADYKHTLYIWKCPFTSLLQIGAIALWHKCAIVQIWLIKLAPNIICAYHKEYPVRLARLNIFLPVCKHILACSSTFTYIDNAKHSFRIVNSKACVHHTNISVAKSLPKSHTIWALSSTVSN